MPEGVAIHRNGIELPKGLTPEQWHEIGSRLAKITAGVLFMWGDFFAYAEEQFKFHERRDGRRHLADGIYDEWAPRTGFDATTLKDAKYVCQAVNLSRRRDSITFSQLREIVGRAPEGQVEFWQDKVLRERLTVRALRAELKRAFAKHNDKPVAPATSFIDVVQRFVDDYRRASTVVKWDPRFKREVAKTLVPVYRDLESFLREL